MEVNKKQASFFRFEDLRLYDKAAEYSKWLVGTLKTKATSKAEETLVDDFVRASLCVAKCIAEGAYYSKKEFELYLKNQCMKTTFNGIEVESFAWYKKMLGVK